MPGRNAYPIRLLEATNNRRHLTKQEIERRKSNEPTVKSNSLKCPTHLGDAEKKEWRRIVRLYQQVDGNILCDLDSNLLEQYVVEWVRWRKAQAEIQKSSEVVRDTSGGKKTMANPWLEVERSASAVCIRVGSLLMLDVVSRAKIGSRKEEEAGDQMADFLRDR